MRFSSILAAGALLLAPTLAQTTSEEDATTTVTSFAYTTTVTMTLLSANTTTTMHYSSAPTGYNGTSTSYIPTTVNKPSLTAYPSAAASTPCSNCMTNNAGSQHVNMAVAAMFGAAALAWGSL